MDVIVFLVEAEKESVILTQPEWCSSDASYDTIFLPPHLNEEGDELFVFHLPRLRRSVLLR